MKKNIFAIIFCVTIPLLCISQESGLNSLRNGFGFVPLYTISGGLRFDIDRSISKTSNQWLIFSPQLFIVTGNRYGHEFEQLTGFGIDIKHRVFLKPQNLKPENLYFEYGGMFQYFSIYDYRTYSTSYFENGIEYFTVEEGNINTRLCKYGGNFHFGYQWLFGEKVYLDLYAGAGIRVSFNNRNEGFDTWYNNSWVDYGYSGTLLDAGFRFGFYF